MGILDKVASSPGGAEDTYRWCVPAALGIVAAIALVDIFYPYFSFAILFAIPLMLIALTGRTRLMWGATALFVVLTFVQHFLKYTLNPPEVGPQYVNYRMLNRGLVAVMMCMLGLAMDFWIRSERQISPPSSPAHDDALPPGTLSAHANEMRRTFDAMLACVIFPALVVVIFAADLFTSANLNLAILYAVPLFVCAWTRSRTLLWAMLLVVIGLTAIGYAYGPPPVAGSRPWVMKTNRAFAGLSMLAVTLMLHVWIGASEKRATGEGPARTMP